MKNKTVKMLLAAAVLVVCCGVYAGITSYVASQEQTESEADEEETTTVFSASADDVRSLEFAVDDKETVFEKVDDVWMKKDETDFPVDQTTLDNAVSAVTSIDSDRVLEEVEDLSEYGLDEPSNVISIVSEAEEETNTTMLYVGDENQSTGQYYIRKDNDEKTVYLVDASCVEPFAKTLYDYAQMEDFPVVSATDTISNVKVEGSTNYILSKDENTSLWSVAGESEDEKADSGTVSSLISSFGSMAYDSLVNYKCTDKSEYGLEDPYAEITVDYQEEVEIESEESTDSDPNTEDESDISDVDEETEEEPETKMEDRQLKITVGDQADSSNRYVMVNDSDQIYRMSNTTLDELTEKTEEDFWDMTVSYVSLNNLGSLKITYQNEDYALNVSRETSEDEDGEETETVTYKLNGKEIESTDISAFYNKLINMAAQKRLTEIFEPESEPEMSVIFTEEDGDTLEVNYYSYDTNYYAAVVDKKTYLINKMNVKDLFSAFDTFVGAEDQTE